MQKQAKGHGKRRPASGLSCEGAEQRQDARAATGITITAGLTASEKFAGCSETLSCIRHVLYLIRENQPICGKSHRQTGCTLSHPHPHPGKQDPTSLCSLPLPLCTCTLTRCCTGERAACERLTALVQAARIKQTITNNTGHSFPSFAKRMLNETNMYNNVVFQQFTTFSYNRNNE